MQDRDLFVSLDDEYVSKMTNAQINLFKSEVKKDRSALILQAESILTISYRIYCMKLKIWGLLPVFCPKSILYRRSEDEESAGSRNLFNSRFRGISKCFASQVPFIHAANDEINLPHVPQHSAASVSCIIPLNSVGVGVWLARLDP